MPRRARLSLPHAPEHLIQRCSNRQVSYYSALSDSRLVKVAEKQYLAEHRRTEGEPIFDEARAPTGDELAGLLDQIVARLMKMLTRAGHLVEEQAMTYLADTDADHPLATLQAASCTYRIALGPRAGQKVLSLRTVAGRDEKITHGLCADAHGFSLHAAVRCGADQRKQLEQLCRYITRPALANERLTRNAKGQVVLKLKSPYRDGTTHIVMQPQEFMQRLAALVR